MKRTWAWRAAHPEYQERENARRTERRRQARLDRNPVEIQLRRDQVAVSADPGDRTRRAFVRLVHRELAERDLTARSLARRIGTNHQPIYRLLDSRSNPTLTTVAIVADSLGYRVRFLPKRAA